MLYDEANKCTLWPQLTGIPPHVVILNEMTANKDKIYNAELNTRDIGGDAFQANPILEDVRHVMVVMKFERVVVVVVVVPLP